MDKIEVLEIMRALEEEYKEQLREFRLTGDNNYLYDFFCAVMNKIQNINIDKISSDFFTALTDNEKKAFQAIREQIGSEGNFSVVKMIQKTSLSRPVFTSLLVKMEKYQVAEVKNQGVKGTYIKMKI